MSENPEKENDNIVQIADGAKGKQTKSRLQRWNPKRISLIGLLPSALTLLAIYFGFTSFYFTTTGNFQVIVGLIFACAFLDMLDGRVARFTQKESRLGEQLDSLADFLNFGVAPAFAMWSWGLKGFGNLGWVLAFFFVICCALRLARFNVQLEEDASYSKKYFEGVPAPAGGLLIFLPMVLSFLGLENKVMLDGLVLIFTIGTGLLMVSTIPTFSLKRLRIRLPRQNFIPALLIVASGLVMIFNFPFPALLLLGVVYLLSIPVTIFIYGKERSQQR